ncbi:helix-turn-helix transcriptional regulator [Actinotalea sp. M2MS4P-6]|uniref:helix-turn-helix transcriptional regulator n=1 Tax=Actinotalea sp. M2MS4P-6 TaxID=2983762 RepID=UPI0021E3A5D2|nr:PAS and helix-turn-helix domain-containing protein [Actinotalea sp. M2MS4P-6]MCV2393316.1 helix-turn-helix transcriptional regulator [Actinotalea sp. M2MS4P-6]
MRTDPVRQGLDALARTGLPWEAFAIGALELLRRAVPFDAACVGPADPRTALLTGSAKIGLHNEKDFEFLRHEYLDDSVNLFSDLAKRDFPVAILVDDTDGHPEVVSRYRELFVPEWDLGHEVRAAAVLEGRPWAGFSLYRASGAGGFSPAEAEFLAGIAPSIARGVRVGLVAEAADAGLAAPGSGPAVLVVGSDDRVVQASTAAQERVAELGGSVWERLPTAVGSIVAVARAMAAGRSDLVPRLRVRSRTGQWLVVHASPLASPDGGPAAQVAVTIEEAGPADVVPLVVAALGLTGRERDVLAAVVHGASTQEIARSLHLSPYTVQDHLKVIFDKAGVGSRRELIAKVVLEQYQPRYGSRIGTSGWFVDEGEAVPA